MRLIDADATLDLLKSLGSRDYRRSKGTIAEAEKMLMHDEYTPTIDTAPAQHGHWIETIENGKMKRVTSCCGDNQTTLTCWCTPRYCPNCGAKMDGGIIEAWKERANEPPRGY